MLTVVDQWKPKVTKITNVTIGRTAVELMNKCHQKECNVGNLIADSYVYYVCNFKLKIFLCFIYN